MKKIFLFLSCFLLSIHSIASHFNEAKRVIRSEIKLLKIDVGVSVLHLESGEAFSLNGKSRFPMASVYKFPIALVLLKKVEDGKVSLSEKVMVSASDIRGGYKGPIAKKYPKGGVSLPVSTLLKFMVSNSDNSASDLILKLIGGPKIVTKTLKLWGFEKISVDRYEKALIAGLNDAGTEKLDTASADDLIKAVKNLFLGKLLSKSNTGYLINLMTNVKTPGHIARGLPNGTPQFHKSGWCAKNKCINDVAMITLPKKRGHLALAILISGDIKDTKKISKIIGKIARTAYKSAVKIDENKK